MISDLDQFQSLVRSVFQTQGRLAQDDAHFKPRSGQLEMALAVASALFDKTALVVEAGTGVGKTFAYLVPALLCGHRTLISTATKTLQDQLFDRDIPRLMRVLGVTAQTALLKGRSNYLCLQRLEMLRTPTSLPDRQSQCDLVRVQEWASTTSHGDLAELPGLDERATLLPFITSTRDNCLGSECGHFKNCHLMVARRKAMSADVVVVNHHLFFADQSVRESGVAEILPTVDAVIFDEAHQLNDTGLQFFGQHLSSVQWLDLARDLQLAGLTHARSATNWGQRSDQIEKAARDFRLLFAAHDYTHLAWGDGAPLGVSADSFRQACEQLTAAAQAGIQALDTVLESAPDFQRLKDRSTEMVAIVDRFLAPPMPGRVRWAEVNTGVRVTESELDIAEAFKKYMHDDNPEHRRAWVFTSATLGHDAQLSWFTRSCGLEQSRVLRVQSPFDYKRQGVLLVPHDMVPPQDPQHSEQVAWLAEQVVRALGGRTLVLTTTLRALRHIGTHLQNSFPASSQIQVLVQGETSKRVLAQTFQSGGNHGSPGNGRGGCVLVASASFWQGFDVPGDALQAVIIDKLPFPPPSDPLVEARVRALELQGGRGFMDYFLPEAAVALKQGAGRLIRRESDKGALVVCDTRLLSTGYGKTLIAAMPAMARVTDIESLLAALQRLRQSGSGERNDSPEPPP